MLRGSEIIGKPVVTRDSGERRERVQDVLFDQSSQQVAGFLLSEGERGREARVLPIEHVTAVGQDAIIADGREAIVPAAAHQKIAKILERDMILKGTRIMTTEGQEVGKLTDFYFNEKSGDVLAYEVSGGLFNDLKDGKCYMSPPSSFEVGQDVIFVPQNAVENLARTAPNESELRDRADDDHTPVAEDGHRARINPAQEAFASGLETVDDAKKVSGYYTAEPATTPDVAYLDESGHDIGNRQEPVTATNRDLGDEVDPDLRYQGDDFANQPAAHRDESKYELVQPARDADLQMPEDRVDHRDQRERVDQSEPMNQRPGNPPTDAGWHEEAGLKYDMRGGRIRRAVIAPDGTLVAAEGDIVDEAMLKRAREHDVADALYHAVEYRDRGVA